MMAMLGGLMQVCAVLWALFGAGNIALAAKAGTDELTLAVLIAVLVYWIPAAIVFYIGSRLRASAEGKANLRPCPKCAEPIQLAATLCKHCGSTVPPALKPDPYGAA